jgi:hypothetical protein
MAENRNILLTNYLKKEFKNANLNFDGTMYFGVKKTSAGPISAPR